MNLFFRQTRRGAVTPVCVTGGLRFAATTGYFLATLRVASFTSNLNSRMTDGNESSPSSSFEAAHFITYAPYSANPARSRAKFPKRGFEGLRDNQEIISSDLKTNDRPVAPAPNSVFVDPPAVDV